MSSTEQRPLRVLLTGAAGQLGTVVRRRAPASAVIAAFDRAALDIADERAVRRAVATTDPELIINAAAYTAVDRAEWERDKAFRANAEGPAILAAEAARAGVRLLHLSTDFVFDGVQRTPYHPDAACQPLSVYGASKRAGEEAILRQTGQALIVRTSWLYSGGGANFVRTMLRLFQAGGDVRVVDDQVGSPTWAVGLADALWACAARPDLNGILHWADSGRATWYELACAVGEEGVDLGLLAARPAITPVSTAEFGSPAPRPPFSVLDTSDCTKELGMTPVPWRVNLRHMLEEQCNAA